MRTCRLLKSSSSSKLILPLGTLQFCELKINTKIEVFHKPPILWTENHISKLASEALCEHPKNKLA